MRVSVALVVAALTSFVSCQLPNSFEVPATGSYPTLTAGQPYTFTWENLSGSTVTLTLRDGDPSHLNQGSVIQANVPNTGSFTYTPTTDTPAGSTYTVQISNDQDPTEVNYTPPFQIISSDSDSASASESTSVIDAMISIATDTMTVTSMVTDLTSMDSTATTSIPSILTSETDASAASASIMSVISGASSAITAQETGGALQSGARLLHAGAGLAVMAVMIML